MNSLKYNLLSETQIYDKEIEAKFVFVSCIVTNIKISEVILVAKRCKNIYVADIDSIYSECLKF